jgi:flagellar protein FlgJ
MPGSDGRSSLNLFGIKAGSGWQGGSVAKATLEYEKGLARHEVAKFRAYPDVASTFDDYVELIGEHPRYAAVRNSGNDARAFADALQDSGYATDPSYADKIENVLKGETMREALRSLKNEGHTPILNGYRAPIRP